MNGFFTRVGISEINFPWVIPNINRKTNQIDLNYIIGGVTTTETIELEYGFYTPAQIATLMVGQITQTAGLETFTMTYGTAQLAIEPVFEYTSTLAGVTGIYFTPVPTNTATYPFSDNTKQLFDLLGFSARNAVPPSSGNQIGNYTLCQATRYVDIVCTQLTNNQALKDQTSQPIARDLLARLYLGDGGGTGQSTVAPDEALFCPPGCAPLTIYRNYATPKQIQWIPNQPIPGYLAFQVYDMDGELLDDSLTLGAGNSLLEGVDWSMTMMVSEN